MPTPIRLVSDRYDNAFKAIVAGGWANASDGDVASPAGYFARVSIAANELAELRDACDLTDAFDLTGHYFTCENDQGIIWVLEYASEADTIATYEKFEAGYHNWLDAECRDPETDDQGNALGNRFNRL